MSFDTKSHNLNNNKEKYLLYFSLLDILFLPYFPLISITYGQVIIFFWFLSKPKKYFDKSEYRAWFIFVFFSFLGTLLSVFTTPTLFFSETIVENIKRFIQYSSNLSYYFFFVYMFSFSNIKINMKKILIYFLLFSTAFALVYILDFDLFIRWKSILNPKDSFIILNKELDEVIRYNFLWSDPNNVGAVLVAVVVYLYCNIKTNLLEKLISLILLVINLVAIMSSAAWLCLAISFFFIFTLKIEKEGVSSFIKPILFIGICVLIVILISPDFSVITGDDVVKSSIDRFESNSSDSRFVIWERFMTEKPIIYYFLTGVGDVVFFNGRVASPHNGHLYLIYAFGLGGYLSFLYFFRKRKFQSFLSYIYMFPIFVCFSINLGIKEQKFLILVILLLSYDLSQKKQTYE